MPSKGRSAEAGSQISLFPNDPTKSYSLVDPEAVLGGWHTMFNYRPYDGGSELQRLVEQEESRKWREFLKRIGAVTPAERQAYLREVVAPEQVAFLQGLGVWDQIGSGDLGANEIEELLATLRAPQQYSKDPYDGEEATIYSSPAALARRNAKLQVHGGNRPRMRDWVGGRRRRMKK